MIGDLLPLVLPAAFVLLALPFGFRTRIEDRQVRAVYLFHESGDPLAMVASDHLPPFPAQELEPLLGTIRDFVETSVPASRGFAATRMRFGEEGLVAVRGRHVSACIVFRSQADGAIRRDLTRFVRDFEAQNEDRLGTWEEATSLAETASDSLRSLFSGREDVWPATRFAVASTA